MTVLHYPIFDPTWQTGLLKLINKRKISIRKQNKATKISEKPTENMSTSYIFWG